MHAWMSITLAALAWGRSEPTTFLHILFPVVLSSLVIYTVYRAIGWSRAKPETNRSVPTKASAGADPKQHNDQNKKREPGVWIPQTFDYPEVIPCPHPIKDIAPVPYRPFRWGEYHWCLRHHADDNTPVTQLRTAFIEVPYRLALTLGSVSSVTMGIRTMPWTEWMELDESFSLYQRIRQHRVNHCGRTVLHVLPAREDGSVKIVGGAEAVKELLYELAEYLPQRYPSSFHISRLSEPTSPPSIGGIPLSWHGKMPIKTIEVMETGSNYDLEVLESMAGIEMGEEAFKMINGLVQDDIAIMIEGTDGKYYFQAGLICVPGAWRLCDKIGMPLDEVHLSGEVPQFKEKLQLSMNRFFQRLPVDKPVIRNNYSIQIIPLQQSTLGTGGDAERTLQDIDPEELSWATSVYGPEDEYARRKGAHSAQDVPFVSPSTLRLRSERQTLRRLPRTGAIVFGIRTYQFKVEELAKEHGVAARLASAVRGWPEDIAQHKGHTRYQDVLLGFLDECAEKDGITGPTEEMLPFPY